jgi:outer membrane protein insertion porin family
MRTWRTLAARGGAPALAVAVALSLWPAVAPDAPRAQNPFLQQRDAKRIQQISIFGNRVTKEYVIRRELRFHEGDVYDAEAVASAWERLEKLDFISYVDIQEKQPSPGEVILVIQVEEEGRLSFIPGTSYDDRYGGVSLEARALYRNFRGHGEVVELDASWLKLHAFRLGWTNPWILGRAHLGVSLDGEWKRYDFRYEPFHFEEPSGQIAVWRDLGRWARATTSFAYRNERIDDSEQPAAFPDHTIVDPVLALRLEHDSRDLRYYPRKGVHAVAEVRYGALGQGRPYTTYEGLLAGFYAVPVAGILAGRIDYHASSTALPFYERAYLGGAENLRGVDFGRVRGDESWLATVELRKPLFLLPLREGRTVGLGLHAFHDWGKAWAHGAGFDSAPVRWSWGAGAHLNVNIANLRFEWVRNDLGVDSFVFEDRFTF